MSLMKQKPVNKIEIKIDPDEWSIRQDPKNDKMDSTSREVTILPLDLYLAILNFLHFSHAL